MTQADGWYPDPAGKAETFRWWDGAAWTRFLSTDRAAPPPSAPSSAPSSAPPGAPPHPPPEAPPNAPSDASPDAPAPERPADSPADPDQPRVRLAVAVGTVVAVLLVAIVAVGAVVAASTNDLPEGSAAPPAAPPSAAVVYDSASREAEVAEVSVTLPDVPYSCAEPAAAAPIFTDAAICDTAVFENYQGDEDWYAGIGFGIISEDLVADDDLRTTARSVFDALQAQYYTDEKTTARNFLPQELPDIPTTQAVALAGELHYEIDGLTPRYDKVLLIVVELRSGEHVVWFSARPDGAPVATVDSLNASLDSFAIRT